MTCRRLLQSEAFYRAGTDPGSLFTSCQLAVSRAHGDVIQTHRATVPQAPAGAHEDHLECKGEQNRHNISSSFVRNGTVV